MGPFAGRRLLLGNGAKGAPGVAVACRADERWVGAIARALGQGLARK